MHPALPLVRQRHRAPLQPKRQRGVVLIVALVMLAIIGLMSAAVMRNALSNDVVSDNNRRSNQATQAAQAALRYCEQLLTGEVTVPAGATALSTTAAVGSVANESWNSFGNWKLATNAGGPVSVPSSVYASTKAPQCMAQKRALGTSEVIVVTARGFSDNYAENSDASGRTKAGSVVWLQSIIRLETL